MSKTSLVLTVLGQDRPGLVDAIAHAVTEHGGNWVESRMAHLAGQFAGILRVEVDSGAAEALTQSLSALSAGGLAAGGLAAGGLAAGGLQSVVHADVLDALPQQCPLVKLSLVGQDRVGIVREISRILAVHGVNVEELNTECKRAPNSGQKLFQAEAQLRLPAGVSIDTLHAALEQVAADMMVDLRLE